MASERTKIFIVDDNKDICANIELLLSFYDDMLVLGSANSAEEAFDKLHSMSASLPDIVLMDINMPGMDGIAATELLSEKHPDICVVIISVQGEGEYLQRAIAAGARGYLVKPFECEDLIRIVKQALKSMNSSPKITSIVNEDESGGSIITAFSTKAGVGKTTLAVNVATKLATREKVVLVDTDVKNGDVALFLGVDTNHTLKSCLLKSSVTEEVLINNLFQCTENLYVLPAIQTTGQPYSAEISPVKMKNILSILQKYFPYVVVDTMPVFSEANINIMHASDKIMLITSLDMPSIKNSLISQELIKNLKCPSNRFIRILNRANSAGGMSVKDAERILSSKFDITLPSEGRIVMEAANNGKPFVTAHPTVDVSIAINKIAQLIDPDISNIVPTESKNSDISDRGVDLMANKDFIGIDSSLIGQIAQSGNVSENKGFFRKALNLFK